MYSLSTAGAALGLEAGQHRTVLPGAGARDARYDRDGQVHGGPQAGRQILLKDGELLRGARSCRLDAYVDPIQRPLLDLELIDPRVVLEEHRNEDTGDTSSVGGAENVQRTAAHFFDQGQPPAARAPAGRRHGEVADAVPQERHREVVEIRDHDLTHLAG